MNELLTINELFDIPGSGIVLAGTLVGLYVALVVSTVRDVRGWWKARKARAAFLANVERTREAFDGPQGGGG